MPVPLILGGIAAAAGAYGVKKGLDAKEDMDAAEEYNYEASELAEKAQKNTDMARKETSRAIASLGRKKLSILSGSVKKFVHNFSAIKNVDFSSTVGIEELQDFSTDKDWFNNLEQASYRASEIVQGGMGGLAAGTLLAAGSYGAVASGLGGLAVASTGTAIAGLSGAAATNATLAWLGGGALGTGATAFGVAGGMAVLGGLVAGPALAIGGTFMASKAKEARYQASENYDKARAFSEQCKGIRSQLSAIRKRSVQIEKILTRLDEYMDVANDALLDVIITDGEDYGTYSVDKKKTVAACAQLAKTIKIILDTSLLGEDGELTEDSAMVASIENKFIESGYMNYIEE